MYYLKATEKGKKDASGALGSFQKLHQKNEIQYLCSISFPLDGVAEVLLEAKK